jgi:hypothetical protein
MPRHSKKAREHKETLLWEECTLQTYFTAKGCINYFVIVNSKGEEEIVRLTNSSAQLSSAERACFKKAEAEYGRVKNNIKEQASVVQDFDSKLARVP